MCWKINFFSLERKEIFLQRREISETKIDKCIEIWELVFCQPIKYCDLIQQKVAFFDTSSNHREIISFIRVEQSRWLFLHCISAAFFFFFHIVHFYLDMHQYIILKLCISSFGCLNFLITFIFASFFYKVLKQTSINAIYISLFSVSLNLNFYYQSWILES